jgi:hypothetical protein
MNHTTKQNYLCSIQNQQVNVIVIIIIIIIIIIITIIITTF